jgi:hypothetical protein
MTLSFETSGYVTLTVAQRNIPENRNPQIISPLIINRLIFTTESLNFQEQAVNAVVL